MYNQQTLEQKIKVLQSSIETVDYQIKHLNQHVNYLQLRAWRKHKKSLSQQLANSQNKLKAYYRDGNQVQLKL